VDDDGFPIYNADPSRLYRPLTRAEYDSIAARTTYTPKSRTETQRSPDQFVAVRPAGRDAFAATVEVGQQAYR
jgi:hypothetical protein